MKRKIFEIGEVIQQSLMPKRYKTVAADDSSSDFSEESFEDSRIKFDLFPKPEKSCSQNDKDIPNIVKALPVKL